VKDEIRAKGKSPSSSSIGDPGGPFTGLVPAQPDFRPVVYGRSGLARFPSARFKRASLMGGFASTCFNSRRGLYRPFQGSLDVATVPTAEAVGY
jgi:hypothetical protein